MGFGEVREVCGGGYRWWRRAERWRRGESGGGDWTGVEEPGRWGGAAVGGWPRGKPVMVVAGGGYGGEPKVLVAMVASLSLCLSLALPDGEWGNGGCVSYRGRGIFVRPFNSRPGLAAAWGGSRRLLPSSPRAFSFSSLLSLQVISAVSLLGCRHFFLLFLLIGEDEEEEFLELEPEFQEIGDSSTNENVQISMHALAGCNSLKTIRVTGRIKGRTLTILIDSGNTHNFIEPEIAKQSSCFNDSTLDLAVAIADGTKLCSRAWLSTLGPILWDFKNLNMQFQLHGKSFVLKGESQMKIEQVSPRQVEKTLQSTKQGFIAHLCCLTMDRRNNEENPDLQISLHSKKRDRKVGERNVTVRNNQA
ncbi:hypothetical protein RHSIM_Rhsim04G0144600 [Rhododendron simsii]|uniref:Uncharacterized protein n=1 Tax=Rhododendron simsii TaxID=118357 RepID=A0A834H4S5_RHOSS|nr:hypothetical protein RHSIM_Rhsim04G0144600 [Rhododendron simsii]